VETRAPFVVLSVRDEGVGMAPEDLKKLFVPFSRLDRTRDMAKGTGLGLSSVKKIVEAHGGSMGITSELGVGTTVEVCLPCADGARSAW
jgi:signal transduction histidine kinase